eukprot:gene23459-30408_t
MSQEIIRGIMHYTEHNEVIKEPILSDESISKGCKVTGDTITDKIGGGTITVLMLIERLLHQSAKALIGKRD